MNRIENFDLG